MYCAHMAMPAILAPCLAGGGCPVGRTWVGTAQPRELTNCHVLHPESTVRHSLSRSRGRCRRRWRGGLSASGPVQFVTTAPRLNTLSCQHSYALITQWPVPPHTAWWVQQLPLCRRSVYIFTAASGLPAGAMCPAAASTWPAAAAVPAAALVLAMAGLSTVHRLASSALVITLLQKSVALTTPPGTKAARPSRHARGNRQSRCRPSHPCHGNPHMNTRLRHKMPAPVNSFTPLSWL